MTNTSAIGLPKFTTFDYLARARVHGVRFVHVSAVDASAHHLRDRPDWERLAEGDLYTSPTRLNSIFNSLFYIIISSFLRLVLLGPQYGSTRTWGLTPYPCWKKTVGCKQLLKKLWVSSFLIIFISGVHKACNRELTKS